MTTLQATHMAALQVAAAAQREQAAARQVAEQRAGQLEAALADALAEAVQAATAPLRRELSGLEMRHEAISHELGEVRQRAEGLQAELLT